MKKKEKGIKDGERDSQLVTVTTTKVCNTMKAATEEAVGV